MTYSKKKQIDKSTMITHIKKLFKVIIIGLLIGSTSCLTKENNDRIIENKQNQELNSKKTTTNNSLQYYHYSSSNNIKYDHQVTGINENGESVNGVINLEHEIGIGIVKGKNDSDEIEIISDQINSNKIIATDINGVQYKLKVDE